MKSCLLLLLNKLLFSLQTEAEGSADLINQERNSFVSQCEELLLLGNISLKYNVRSFLFRALVCYFGCCCTCSAQFCFIINDILLRFQIFLYLSSLVLSFPTPGNDPVPEETDETEKLKNLRNQIAFHLNDQQYSQCYKLVVDLAQLAAEKAEAEAEAENETESENSSEGPSPFASLPFFSSFVSFP